MCGFANLPDRRMLLEYLANSYVVHVTLQTSDSRGNASIMASAKVGPQDSSEQHQTLLGQTTQNGQVYLDLDQNEAIFFVFPDLSIRIQGSYTLKLHLVCLNNRYDGCGITHRHSHVSQTLTTASFVVHPPKTFPGMLAVTFRENIFGSHKLMQLVQPLAFFLFSIGLLFSCYATFTTDFLRVQTALFVQRFGIWESCLSDGTGLATQGVLGMPPEHTTSVPKGLWGDSDGAGLETRRAGSRLEYCQDFPGKCKLQLPQSGEPVQLSFCQAWLVARYLQVAGLSVGIAAWVAWILTMFVALQHFVMFFATVYGTALLVSPVVLTQVIVMQLMTKIREHDIFYIGGALQRLVNSFVCHATLVSEDLANRSVLQRTVAVSSSLSKKKEIRLESTPILFGTNTTSGVILTDIAKNDGDADPRMKHLFFVFPDLSVRVQGDFRICVHLVDMEQ
ncbi:hypothetical protein HDU91_005331 [Kappamyces sp. JEL0680]|nr:hypothetical protein HDU91_005331 [Kappamyces sp. JEL0680]